MADKVGKIEDDPPIQTEHQYVIPFSSGLVISCRN